MADTWTIQDFERHEREKEEWLRSRPICDQCGEPIQEDFYMEPEPGAILCEDCFRQYARDNFLREIE